ncbi:hypothetical protein LJJ44_25455 [Pseudomonas sp. B24_DOA]|nr:hypothetical protein LJJ44_25455 [Pseudomonas sp. B24_DOA]WKV91228.1 hypothetical protein LJU32_05910 [Pseudomonas sp. B21_DOA]
MNKKTALWGGFFIGEDLGKLISTGFFTCHVAISIHFWRDTARIIPLTVLQHDPLTKAIAAVHA